jgi:(p)ppGpp synthase/HD superfamily hydrolase
VYSPRFDLAVTTVLDAHGLATRKRGLTYEASHVIAVAAIVADFGFDEDAIVAALLHDTLEDTSLDPEVIRSRFGELVLAIVRDVTEPSKMRESWLARKQAYIEQVRLSPRQGAWAVASADKIHNMAKIIEGLRSGHPGFWDAFSASPEQMVWYQTAVLEMLEAKWSHPILERQRALVGELARVVGRR